MNIEKKNHIIIILRRLLPAVAGAFFLLLSGCQKEKCSFCEVLGHKEIYIGEFCGTEDFINEQIEKQKRLYPNYDLRCQ